MKKQTHRNGQRANGVSQDSDNSKAMRTVRQEIKLPNVCSEPGPILVLESLSHRPFLVELRGVTRARRTGQSVVLSFGFFFWFY